MEAVIWPKRNSNHFTGICISMLSSASWRLNSPSQVANCIRSSPTMTHCAFSHVTLTANKSNVMSFVYFWRLFLKNLKIRNHQILTFNSHLIITVAGQRVVIEGSNSRPYLCTDVAFLLTVHPPSQLIYSRILGLNPLIIFFWQLVSWNCITFRSNKVFWISNPHRFPQFSFHYPVWRKINSLIHCWLSHTEYLHAIAKLPIRCLCFERVTAFKFILLILWPYKCMLPVVDMPLLS